MKHARADYNRIQDPENKIPEDEPVFLLRAQDELAWRVVMFYSALAFAVGAVDIAKLTEDWADKMRAWPVKKTPDL